MTRRDAAVLGLLFLFALGARVRGITEPPFRWMDENAHLPAASHYWESGQFEPDYWEHPPLRHLMAYGFLRALGDNPWGWRTRNVLFGALAAVLTWLLAFHVGAGRRGALLAGALVATDPLHVVTSRFTFEEIYGGAFFVAAVVVFVARRERSAWLVGSALLAGCALATKWYYAPGSLLLFVLALRERGAWRDPRSALFVATTWTLVPLAVYLAAYFPWFGRGYGLSELPELVVNAYASLQSITERYVRLTDTRTVFVTHLSAAEWFVRPIMTGHGTAGPDRGEFILYGNDLPTWGPALVAAAAMAVIAVRRRDLRLGLPALLFFASYALFLFVRRPAMIYSAVPLLPFAFTTLAQGLSLLSDRLGPKVFWGVAAAMLAWNLYLYPLVTAVPVPLAPYRFVIEAAEIQYH